MTEHDLNGTGVAITGASSGFEPSAEGTEVRGGRLKK
jgi:hypothetical protein